MEILSKLTFCHQGIVCPLCATCYFYVKIIIINCCTILLNRTTHFKNYRLLSQKYRTGKFAFLCLSMAFLVTVAACPLPFTTASGARFIFSSWIGLGWTWASNNYVLGIHTEGAYLIIKILPPFKIHSCWLDFLRKVIWVQFKFSLRVT